MHDTHPVDRAFHFFARIVDVSVGTLRTIVTIQGRIRLAFVLGFIEVTLWVTIISAIVKNIEIAPILAIFCGLGFATGWRTILKKK